MVYQDPRGVYHNIVHVNRANTHGLHYYSTDGVQWIAAKGQAYNATISQRTGAGGQRLDTHLSCRERPHLVLEKTQGQLIALTNGAARTTCHKAGADDYSFTSLQTLAMK